MPSLVLGTGRVRLCNWELPLHAGLWGRRLLRRTLPARLLRSRHVCGRHAAGGLGGPRLCQQSHCRPILPCRWLPVRRWAHGARLLTPTMRRRVQRARRLPQRHVQLRAGLRWPHLRGARLPVSMPEWRRVRRRRRLSLCARLGWQRLLGSARFASGSLACSGGVALLPEPAGTLAGAFTGARA